jgi:hypothetical protein
MVGVVVAAAFQVAGVTALVRWRASVTKMIDAIVSSSDALAVAAGAGKFPRGRPNKIPDSV